MDPSLLSSLPSGFKQLKVAIVGGGIGGLSAAVALRRAGHIGSLSRLTAADNAFDTLPLVVEIFERRSFDVEVGASISCAANGGSRIHRQCLELNAT